MHIDLNVITKTLCSETAGFNLIHFKDVQHLKEVGAHYWVTISLGDDKYMLISMVTSQMQKLERVYKFNNQEKAINCLVPVSRNEFPAIGKGCVVNCNETLLLTKEELILKIDTNYSSRITSNCLDCIHYDYEFEDDFKRKIIKAIENSPLVKGEVKKALLVIKESIQPAA